MGLYVHYGCGLCAPKEWENFDVSPTLRVQKIPLLGDILTRNKVKFPSNVRYGDIVKGLPGIAPGSADGVYCSHVLEHLSLEDCRTALRNTWRLLKPGGIFRLVLPDLEVLARGYLRNLENGETDAAIRFVQYSIMGAQTRERGVKSLLTSHLGNARHLWMWDHASLTEELKKAGFSTVRRCQYHDAENELFNLVEEEERFKNAVALEARK